MHVERFEQANRRGQFADFFPQKVGYRFFSE
jgi:hypothetical protein